MFYENNLIFENAYNKCYDMEYLPSIFSGKIDKEQLI